MIRVKVVSILAMAIVALTAATSQATPIVFSAAGATSADVLGTVNTFRTALGALNPNVVGSFASGRREVNWDGVPAGQQSPNPFAPNFFNLNSPRGVEFSTPGSGFEVSSTVAPNAEFDNLAAGSSSQFAPFSNPRLFTAVGSTITDVHFFVPGTNTPASTTAFGAVFTDVDLANTTSLEFFDLEGLSLGTFFVPNVAGDETFSFLGVQFTTERVGLVRITSGNAPLGTTGDNVVMDDFIFAEPQTAVPEPATGLLLGVGLALFVRRLWRATR